MYKPVPAVFHSAVRVVAWLLQRGLVVWVEPEAHAELAPAVEQYLQDGTLPAASSTATESGGGSGRGGNSAGISIPSGDNGGAEVNGTGFAAAAAYSISGSGIKRSLCSAAVLGTSPLGVSSSSYGGGSLSSSVAALGSSPAGGASGGLGLHHAGSASHLAGSQLSSYDSHDDNTAAPAAAATMQDMPPLLRAQPALDVSRQLRTWPDPSACGCPPAVPPSVGHQLDMVVTLGGDGTVLWTCGLFAAGPVPPLVSCMGWWLDTAHFFPVQSVRCRQLWRACVRHCRLHRPFPTGALRHGLAGLHDALRHQPHGGCAQWCDGTGARRAAHAAAPLAGGWDGLACMLVLALSLLYVQSLPPFLHCQHPNFSAPAAAVPHHSWQQLQPRPDFRCTVLPGGARRGFAWQDHTFQLAPANLAVHHMCWLVLHFPASRLPS